LGLHFAAKQGNASNFLPKTAHRTAELKARVTMPDDTAAEQPVGLPAHLRDDLKWKPGQSGNPAGRPKGARAKLAEDFCQALLDDFATNGAAAIRLMRAEKPNEYARMIASIMPKEVDASLTGDLSDEMRRWLGMA
jgi:hypothetical protein